MRKPVTLITGASGEIGHGLIERLAAAGEMPIITVDLQPLPRDHRDMVDREYLGSILEIHLLERILSEFEVRTIFHLAALLSTRAEFTPLAGHQVNVEGTLKLLDFAQSQGESHGRPVVFLYPSSIAAYGLPDLETKRAAGRLREHEWNQPTTMYGCNKLYCEHLGRYYDAHYKQLAAETLSGKVDFRSIRFPGLISADTVPSGGTSDYAPEMIHAAAQGRPYACFVRPDTRIPFMAMPDAVDALLGLAAADRTALTKPVYNIAAFNPSAGEIADLVRHGFPTAEISFAPDLKRQAIVDSWPEDVDDSTARADWGLAPRYDLARAFSDYLIPRIRQRY
ncbi:MAG: NAD-dependent epimerase/dehydratase family protein [Thermoanaerobaculales bacterium]|nr:NAD-dependent epimerase/dehydratase family protein [Thermoanaerobaculales bacterium]